MNLLDRLLNKVNKVGDCWEWNGYLEDGYGRIWLQGRAERTHRLSYMIFRGEIPEGICVLHRCDNRKCIRPDHLFLGDIRANNEDMIAKGRNRAGIGERQHRARLTANDIQTIRSSSKRQTELAREFNVTKQNIYSILKRKSWKHL